MLTTLSDVLTGPEKWVKGMAFGKIISTSGLLMVSDADYWDKCCLLGACYITSNLHASLEACKVAINELGFGPRSMQTYSLQAKNSVALFNDHPDTTWEDVSAVSKRADAILKEIHNDPVPTASVADN